MGGLWPLTKSWVTRHLQEMLHRPVHPDSTDSKAWGSPLYFASHRGDSEMVRLLLEARANTDDRRQQNFTALGIACAVGHENVVKVLLEAGEDQDGACTSEGTTPLGAAADRGREEVVRVLLEAGADKEKSWGAEGMTALGLAALQGREDVIRLLLEAGADKEHRCRGGATPLGMASSKGYVGCVRVLLEARAAADASRDDATTPLGAAVRRGGSWSGPSVAIARLLLEAGADKDKASRADGAPPLGIAAGKGHIDMVRLLLQARVDPDTGLQHMISPSDSEP